MIENGKKQEVFRWGDEVTEEKREDGCEDEETSFSSVAELLDEELKEEIRRLENYFKRS